MLLGHSVPSAQTSGGPALTQVTGSPAEPAGVRLSGPDEAISSEDAGDGDGSGGGGGGGTRHGGGQRGDKGSGGRANRQRKRKEPVILDEREQRAQKRMVRRPVMRLLSLPRLGQRLCERLT